MKYFMNHTCSYPSVPPMSLDGTLRLTTELGTSPRTEQQSPSSLKEGSVGWIRYGTKDGAIKQVYTTTSPVTCTELWNLCTVYSTSRFPAG